jgi:hypothetical protein
MSEQGLDLLSAASERFNHASNCVQGSNGQRGQAHVNRGYEDCHFKSKGKGVYQLVRLDQGLQLRIIDTIELRTSLHISRGTAGDNRRNVWDWLHKGDVHKGSAISSSLRCCLAFWVSVGAPRIRSRFRNSGYPSLHGMVPGRHVGYFDSETRLTLLILRQIVRLVGTMLIVAMFAQKAIDEPHADESSAYRA